MLFAIIPHTFDDLLSKFPEGILSVRRHPPDQVFSSVRIVKKNAPLTEEHLSQKECLFFFYDLAAHEPGRSHGCLLEIPEDISYVDAGFGCLCHILTLLTESCPDLYRILEAQYQLTLTQQFMDTLQNGYHVRMRDLQQSISAYLEKKILVIEPSPIQENAYSSSTFFEQIPEHSQIIGYLNQAPIYYGRTPRKDMGPCLILPVYRFGEIIEFLIVGNCQEKPQALFCSALKTVLSALSIEYEMRQSVFTVVNRSRNELMDAITNSGHLSPATIVEWAGLLGFKSRRLYIVMCFDFVPISEKTSVGLSVYYEILEFMIHYYHPNDYYFLRTFPDSLYMIGQFPLDSPEKAQEKSLATCQQIEHLLKTKLIVKKMFAGVGTTQQQIPDISQSYQDGKKALKIAHTTDESIICYETLGILRLLGNIPSGEAVDSYIPRCLKNLQEYDLKYNTCLLETLRTYYSVNCNAAQAAKLLFIHYKTMLNRLERIAQVLDCDYNDSHIRLEIELGIQIIQLNGSKNREKDRCPSQPGGCT